MGRWVNSLLEKNKRVEERERKTKESEVEKETVWWCQFRQKAQSWCVLAGEQRALTDSALLTIKVHTTSHTRTHRLSGRHTNTPTLCVSDFKLLFPVRGHKRKTTVRLIISESGGNEQNHIVVLFSKALQGHHISTVYLLVSSGFIKLNQWRSSP